MNNHLGKNLILLPYVFVVFCSSIRISLADFTLNNQIDPSPPFSLKRNSYGPIPGIPAAFGYLNLDKRTDIVVIGDDGYKIDLYYQEKYINNFTQGYSCKCDKQIAQIYLTDVNSKARPKLLALLIDNKDGDNKIQYSLKGLIYDASDIEEFKQPKFDQGSIYSLPLDDSNENQRPIASALATQKDACNLEDLGVTMTSQPFLFDFDGDLQTDFMSVDSNGQVSVWIASKEAGETKKFIKHEPERWQRISPDYFKSPHSNAFIDIDNNYSADIVLSSNSRIMYAMSSPDRSKTFTGHIREFPDFTGGNTYGQSALVDIDADGIVDHLLPRCNKNECEIVVLYNNSRQETILKLLDVHNEPYRLEKINFGQNYQFPIVIRPGDWDGDGYTDFVTIAKKSDGKNTVLYLRNIESKHNQYISMKRSFQITEVPVDIPEGYNVKLVIPFDIDEDGKMDLLIGSSKYAEKPGDMLITSHTNAHIVDSFSMKVIVTNGRESLVSEVGHSAIGPFVCFELFQNNGDIMKGCAGQMSQSSHFSLQLPYTIFGLGQTPHFVEKLNVSIPGYSQTDDHHVRMRVFEQIVPDAQVIIIPNEIENPENWGHRLFLSPMSQLAASTGIALAVIGLILLIIIAILHRREIKEDAAEHEEYKRHWPESR